MTEPSLDSGAAPDTVERGIVLRGTGGVWEVLTPHGLRRAALRGRLKAGEGLKLAVGDEVELEPGAEDRDAISAILPRRSVLARRAPSGGFGERVVAANIDQVVVVFAAAEPEPHPRMLDRFLVIAAANDLPARIVVNKAELVGVRSTHERWAAYERAGYPLHVTSAKTGEGLDELRDALRGRVSALTGPSGVGKSSLLNAMFPGFALRVGEISRSVNKGRHTTVGADLQPLPDGNGFVMDTPGLREVGVWGLEPAALDHCFLEFRPHLDACRFADCRHRVEPECGVRDAVARGDISAERYDSYLRLMDELEESPRAW